MKIREGKLPFALWTAYADDRIERGQGHAHIARMSGDALFALAEDGVNPIVTVNRAAAAARIPFIACWKRRIVEIIATGSLQKIAADGGHVSQLRTCTRQQRLTQNRVARFNQRVLGQIGITDHRSNPDA